MAGLLSLFFFLPFTFPAMAHRDEAQARDDFLRTCPPSACGSLDIRFPLRLQSAPVSCGRGDLNLTCSGNDTVLWLPSHPPYKVTGIDYQQSLITVKLPRLDNSPCPLQDLCSQVHNLTASLPTHYPPILPDSSSQVSILHCSTKFEPGLDLDLVVGPISPCYAAARTFVYVADGLGEAKVLPHDCFVYVTCSLRGYPRQDNSFAQTVEAFIERRETSLDLWDIEDDELRYKCESCERRGKHCGFDRGQKESFCIGHDGPKTPNIGLIMGTSIVGFLLLSVSAILLYVFRQSKKEKETRVKVEKFLATYKATKPTRYTYSEVKNMTKRFRHGLGQGGFGSVYKGELPNGIPVAVKMLEKYTGEGKEFINEVSTIGRIHHVNVVRLLGFCSEGTRRALVYEFMPNQSLEKYIFSKEGKRRRQPLNVERLLEIVTGIARGIEYLHQGCEQRILHFDIKPHNILLDHNFIPKVSDFGLAKLCSKDNTNIAMTTARGTMGYMAPEVFSRNFGEVSYKSDVYSFGMLLLEMVSGKRIIEPTIENQDEIYFPEWIYSRLICGEDLGLATEKEKEGEIARKITIVALWCIQWSPNDRPTMTRVIQLLTVDVENLEIPPKPFVSAHQDNGTSITGA